MSAVYNWKFAASVCVAALMHGNADAQREAKDEVLRMARILDEFFPVGTEKNRILCNNNINPENRHATSTE